MWCEVWFMVSGEHVYCTMRSNMDEHCTVIVRGAISSKTKVMFRTRMCEQSLLIVSSCYIRVQAMMIAIEEFLFPGES